MALKGTPFHSAVSRFQVLPACPMRTLDGNGPSPALTSPRGCPVPVISLLASILVKATCAPPGMWAHLRLWPARPLPLQVSWKHTQGQMFLPKAGVTAVFPTGIQL